MSAIECIREQEVMETVGSGRWPAGCDSDLREHIPGCANCSSVLELALAMHEERETVGKTANIPSAGLVWWRAELRARQEAMRTASRPITLVEAFGAAAAVGVALAAIVRAWPWLKTMTATYNLSALSLPQWGLVIGFALLVVVAPVAMYFVLSDE